MGKIRWHLAGLLFYSVWVVGLDYFFLDKEFSFSLDFVVLIEEIWIFYTGYGFLYLLFLMPGNRKIYSVPLIIISLSGTYFFNLAYSLVSNRLYKTGLNSQKEIIYSVTQYFTHFFILSIGYFFVIKFYINQKRIKEVEQQTLILQKDLLQSENNFLRAQINPHFLYNCLNFLYSKTFNEQPVVAEAIMTLSQIMRYSLADFSVITDLGNLKEEIEHIKNLIKINEIRFADTLQIKFNLYGDTTGKKITPMLLMTLVENVFKHGNLQDSNYPAVINCKIDSTNKTVQMVTLNKINTTLAKSDSGLGLNNIRQRLEALYKKDFTLIANAETEIYKVQLVMPYFDK